MSFVKRFAKNAKQIPIPVWIAGVIVPGGLTAIGLYTAYKSAKKKKPEQTLGEFVEEVLREEKEKQND